MGIKQKILILGAMLLLSGNMVVANNASAVSSSSVSTLNTGVDGSKICLAEELMKEMIKQTIYSVGSQVLNKYVLPNTAPPYSTQQVAPVAAPVTTTTTPQAVPQPTNTGYIQEEQMIIIK